MQALMRPASMHSRWQNSHGGNGTRLHRIWTNMRQRCYDPNCPKYARYGGRGVTICEEWQDFRVFREWALAHGYADDLSINRTDNDGPYCPENCDWATAKAQSRNRRSSLRLTAFGETKTLAEWAEDPRCNVQYKTLWRRIKVQGRALEEAMVL